MHVLLFQRGPCRNQSFVPTHFREAYILYKSFSYCVCDVCQCFSVFGGLFSYFLTFKWKERVNDLPAGNLSATSPKQCVNFLQNNLLRVSARQFEIIYIFRCKQSKLQNVSWISTLRWWHATSGLHKWSQTSYHSQQETTQSACIVSRCGP